MFTYAPGVLVFDGDCGFCAASAAWVSRSWRPDPTSGLRSEVGSGRESGPGSGSGSCAVAWQQLGAGGLGELGLTVAEAEGAAWWVDAGGRRYRGHRAIAKSLLASRGWKRGVGALLYVPPLSWAGALIYPVVVRYRHRLPGSTPACRI